jgi:hypothetical protein
MDAELLANVLMLHGETRHCADCDTSTVFLPVEGQEWVCTACDAAVLITADPVTVAA